MVAVLEEQLTAGREHRGPVAERGLAAAPGVVGPPRRPVRHGHTHERTDASQLADAAWALTGPQLYTKLTADRGWSTDPYEAWGTVVEPGLFDVLVGRSCHAIELTARLEVTA
ncbi:hypothetical protein OG601_16080 [Streptomyces sp. NBC_01239]|uniref:hypothetical protein n=1 Tax=Streptomyces sp. NBC_01239 TaxID=2903792 RepID=UPI00224CEB5F|nr:hypothetical protein [Streptomyces sp. NBC_01239]MCX4812125.1 hypothetical protein [Streptomyces sp. NBC_01239]